MNKTGINSQQIADVIGKPVGYVNSAVSGTPSTGNGRDWSWATGGNTDPYNTKPVEIGSPAGGGIGTPGGGMGGGSVGDVGSLGLSNQKKYLDDMAKSLTDQATTAFNRNVVPAIGSNAMAAGGYGGSRQGVVEANATNDLNQNITNSLASLYNNGYSTGLQYDLGLRNNSLGFANLDRNIANDNLGWQMQGANFGLGLYDRLMQGNQTGINAGTNIQNTPMNYWGQFTNQFNGIGQGYGTQSTSGGGGNPIAGALGGMQLGSQVANMWGGSQGANTTNFWAPNFAGSMGD